ncbi:MAG: response regulator [Acidobacteria bacterium]|nr:response regulator [Acidobacteriota bacterium]
MAHVLLVEDNELNRDMLSRRLKRCGWVVSSAEDGWRAVCMAEQERPDVILMDLSLPVLSGWDATRKIRQMPEINDIPIIALSAHAMLDDRTSALAAGCDDFETKPIDFDRLVTKMNALRLERFRDEH